MRALLSRRSLLISAAGGALASACGGRADSTPSPAAAPLTSSLPAAPASAATASPSAIADAPVVSALPAAPGPTPEQIAASAELDARDIQVEGDRTLGRHFLLCVPKYVAPGERLPLLVLLHGLGETGDEQTGIFAWVDRYGLRTAYRRLRRPPIERTSKRNEWTDERLAEVNASLAKTPYSGACIVCPYTPNVHKLAAPAAGLDAYARWITEVVIPRARKEAPVHGDAARTAIDGCSLGGYVAIEVFLRSPAAFGALGGVQAAVGEARAQGHADRLAAALSAGPRPIHLLTSSGDPFLVGNRRLAAALRKHGVACGLRVLPGPHDQPWLREAGTIEMLLWHDRRA